MGTNLLIIITISEISIYGILYSGWASNNKYSLLGSLRSTAQMISYSISISLIILIIYLTSSSIDLFIILNSQISISKLYIYPLLPISFLFFISIIAETSRAPMDFQEAESELVSGFNTEYSGISFAFFFLGEYSSMLFYATLFFIFFFGFSISLPFLFFFFWLRASLPRLRLDQLLYLNWYHILPFLIGYLICLPIFLFNFNILT